MANLFDLITNIKNKAGNSVSGLYNKLATPAVMPIQLADNTDFTNEQTRNIEQPAQLDLQKTFEMAEKMPLKPKERLFGRSLTLDTENVNPETNELTTERMTKFQPGFFNDLASGARENYITGFAAPNLTDNKVNGHNKGVAYRIGEGLGSLARFGESPLGRSLLVGGLVGATGGSGLEALAYGAQTGMLNQGNRNQDRLYRDDLQRQGIDTSGVRGYINKDVYSNMINSKQLQDNAAWRKLYFDAQQENNKINRDFRFNQLAHQQKQDAIENALKARGLDIQEQRYNNQDKVNQKTVNDLAGINAIEQQLNQFSSMFKDMPGKLNTNTIGNLRSWTGMQTPQQAEFESRKNLLFNKIARDLGGEKGVLSDQDIARVKEAMPLYTDSFEQKQAKMNAIYDLLSIAKNKIMYSIPTTYTEANNTDPLGLGL